jgi:hypothetical protein
LRRDRQANQRHNERKPPSAKRHARIRCYTRHRWIFQTVRRGAGHGNGQACEPENLENVSIALYDPLNTASSQLIPNSRRTPNSPKPDPARDPPRPIRRPVHTGSQFATHHTAILRKRFLHHMKSTRCVASKNALQVRPRPVRSRPAKPRRRTTRSTPPAHQSCAKSPLFWLRFSPSRAPANPQTVRKIPLPNVCP